MKTTQNIPARLPSLAKSIVQYGPKILDLFTARTLWRNLRRCGGDTEGMDITFMTGHIEHEFSFEKRGNRIHVSYGYFDYCDVGADERILDPAGPEHAEIVALLGLGDISADVASDNLWFAGNPTTTF